MTTNNLNNLNGAQIAEKYGLDNIDELRTKIIKFLKEEEGPKRIREYDGNTERTNDDWIRKSQNFQDIKMLFSNVVTPTQAQIDKNSEATEILDRKDRYVVRINELEQAILLMTQEELNNLNVSDDANWEGLDDV